MSTSTTPEQQFHSHLSKNVRILESSRREINTRINNCLRKGDFHSLHIYTNIYLLIYSAWTEASLVKLVHTPSGFTLDEKKKILKDQDVLNKWKQCVNTAFAKFRSGGSEIPNKKKKIHRYLDDYLKTQANIRNKVAHGQWEYPLQKNNITHDADVETLMRLVNVIEIDIWFEIFKEIIEIVKGLVDSRVRNDQKAHYLHYFQRLTNIQEIIEKRKKFSLEEKTLRLKLKPIKS
jgi:hypothetical protein